MPGPDPSATSGDDAASSNGTERAQEAEQASGQQRGDDAEKAAKTDAEKAEGNSGADGGSREADPSR